MASTLQIRSTRVDLALADILGNSADAAEQEAVRKLTLGPTRPSIANMINLVAVLTAVQHDSSATVGDVGSVARALHEQGISTRSMGAL